MSNDIGVEPGNAVMIGDTISADVNSPKSIGLQAIHLNRKERSSNSIATLEEIFSVI